MSDEAHLPAEQPRPQPSSRLPRPHGDQVGPSDPELASRPRPQEALRLNRLTKRADYLAANRGKRAPTRGFVLLARDRKDGDTSIRYGLTVSRKVGGAVVRNRMKRRLRELVRAHLPERGTAGVDYVLIGRREGIERDFSALADDLLSALSRVAA